MDTGPVQTKQLTMWKRYGRCRMTSKLLLNDSMSKYLARLAMSSHMMCCSRLVVGDTQVLSMTRQSLQMTFRATVATFAADKLTAVSAMISA